MRLDIHIRCSALLGGLVDNRILLGLLNLLEPGGLLDLVLLLQLLLGFLLRLLTSLTLLSSALLTTLGKSLVPDELAIHALHRHLARAPGLLDAIPVILVDLIVCGVILGLRHGCG